MTVNEAGNGCNLRRSSLISRATRAAHIPRVLAMALLTAVWACHASGAGAEPRLVHTFGRDVTHGGIGPYFRTRAIAADTFAAYLVSTREHHLELWRSDGTPEGSRRLRVVVHNGKSNEYAPDLTEDWDVISYGHPPVTDGWERFPEAPGLTFVGDRWGCALGDRIFFASLDPEHARDTTELFVTDGTLEGTRIVKDIHPGPSGSGILHMTPAGERVFFFADDGVHGKELWVTDGSETGTRMVTQLHPGPHTALAACGIYPFAQDTQAVAHNGTFYFVARDDDGSFALWRSDGTAGGTIVAATPYRGRPGLRPTELTATPSGLYWVTADHCGRLQPGDGVPRELWRFSVGEGAQPVGSFARFGAHLRQENVYTGHLTAAGDAVYFLADDGRGSLRVWRARGAETEAVTDFGVEEGLGLLGTAGERLVLARMAEREGRELPEPWLGRGIEALYVVEPGAAGAVRVNGVVEDAPVPLRLPRYAPPLLSVEDTAFFVAAHRARRARVLALEPGTASARIAFELPREAWPMAVSGGDLYFAAEGDDGLQVWAAPPDGQPEPCTAIPGLGVGTQLMFFDEARGMLYGLSEDQAGRRTFWRSDGQPGGRTQAIFTDPPREDRPGAAPRYDFVAWDGATFFLRDGALHRIEDTATESRVVKHLGSGAEARLGPLLATETGLVFFVAERGAGIQRWHSRGDPASTRPVGDPVDGSLAGAAAAREGTVYFEAVTGGREAGSALWRAEAEGATAHKLMEGFLAGALTAFTPTGDALTFADAVVGGWRIWRAEGDRVAPLGMASSSFGHGATVPMTALDDGRVAFFRAGRDGDLCISDGGSVTACVPTRSLDDEQVLMSGLAAHDGMVYWVAGQTGFGPLELWQSDGSPAGTRRLHVFGDYLMHELPLLAVHADTLYVFFAGADRRDDVYRELWAHDPAGGVTSRVAQSDPLLGTLWEPGSELSVQLAAAAGTLFFTNYTYDHGAALWVYDAGDR